MPLVSSPLPNLVGGVSQQPSALRLPTSCRDMINAWPSVVSGNQKRPATQHVSSVGLTLSGGVASYLIERDPTYRYMVLVTNGDLKVINLNNGALQTVNFPDGKSYLTATSPVDSFRFVTIGDYSFVVNRNVKALESYIGETGRFNPATRGYVYVTTSQYNSYYSVYINNSLMAQYLSPSGASGSAACPDTATIAGYLETDLNGHGYTTTRVGSLIAITNLSATDKVICQAGTGDKSARGFKDRVASFSDLPYQAPEGTIIRIAADPKENTDDYFVVYKDGAWVETYGWQQQYGPTASTMPHVLVRNSDGTWTFKNHVWDNRVVGDTTTCQSPSFVNAYINDIFTYSNRLGFLADENIILSETDNYENFYRTTVAQILDSDRIDIAVLNNNVQVLTNAVPYNRDLLICSETSQYRLTYQNYLGPKNVQVKFTTAFNMSKRIRPVSMGNSIYFVDDRADYTYMKVWEYFPKDLAISDDADDITAQVPEYIPYDCSFFLGSNRAKAAVLSTASDPTTLYFYKFFWSGDKKVQTAWHKWTFNDVVKIHSGAFSGTYLYLLIERSDGLNLERIRFDEDVFDTNTNYEILLDRRSTNVTKTYSSVTKKTTITLPWSTTSTVEVIGSDPVGTTDGVSGIRYDVTKVDNTTVTVDGDVTSQVITVGLPYTWLYEFSTFYFKQEKGGGQVVILDGRLQLRYVTVEYHNTAFFQTHVKLPGRDEFVATYNGRVAGDFLNTLGTQAFSSGKYRIAVMGKNEEVRVWLTNDSPFPHAFGSAEWQGIISPKSVQRV